MVCQRRVILPVASHLVRTPEYGVRFCRESPTSIWANQLLSYHILHLRHQVHYFCDCRQSSRKIERVLRSMQRRLG